MESSEVPLLETSSEDESLLQQYPPDDHFYFPCSPLIISRSHIPPPPSINMTSNVDSKLPGCASSFNNKENLNTSDGKSGIPRLSVEKQKMKKSRKTGGYNLRKSLAWDRAFFTEEGVLDSSELSIISGISDGENLSVINEQGRDSLDLNSETVHALANLETLEEELFKELPSSQPDKRNILSSSLLKQNTSTGGRQASVFKSSQKVPAGCGANKPASQGRVSCAPMTPVSQKRLLNAGPTKNVTRISKIPRVPIAKQNPSFPSPTTLHTTATRSRLKYNEIAQPARKNASQKVSSNIKNVSNAKASSGCTAKSTKPSAAQAGKNLRFSNLGRDSLTNCKAQLTNKKDNHLERTSNQGLSTGEADVVKPIDGTSSTRVSSHILPDNAGCNRKDIQVQGIKPSGLRMPSPSLRFFSEGNTKPSNLKSGIPTANNSVAADDIPDFKQTQLLCETASGDAKEKARLSSNMIGKCSPSSIVDPTTHAKAIQSKCSTQVVQPRVPLAENIPGETNELYIFDTFDGFNKHYKDQTPTSLKEEEKDRNNNEVTSSSLEFVDANSKITSVFRENATAEDNMWSSSFGSCSQVQPTVLFAETSEVQSQLSEAMGCNSSGMNDVVHGAKNDASHHNKLTLAAETSPSNNIAHDFKTPGGGNSTNSLDQFSSEGSMHVKLDEFADTEQVEMICDSDLSTAKISGCSKGQDNASGNPDSHERNCSFFRQDKNFSMNLKENDSTEISNLSLEMSALREPILQEKSSFSGSSLKQPSDIAVKLDEFADTEQVEMICDSDLSTAEIRGCSKGQDNASGNQDSHERNCSFFCQDKNFSMNLKENDSKEISNVSLEMLALREPMLPEKSSFSGSSLKQPSDNAVQSYDSPNSSRGEKEQPWSFGHGVVNTSGSHHCDSIAYNHCTEVTDGTNNEADEPQTMNDELLVGIPIAQNDDLNLKDDTLLEESSLGRNQEKCNAGVSVDVHKLSSRVEKVDDQIDSISFLSKSGNDSVLQTTDLKFQFSVRRGSDEVTSAEANPVKEESFSEDNRHGLPLKDVSCSACQDVSCSASLDIESVLDHSALPGNNKTITSPLVDGKSKCDMKGMDCTNEENANLKRGIDDHRLMRPASNAVPFSDEWLAAIESAGEEILTLKTGAVQHSPPEKSVPEPSPWSPVKKKSNQVVGPFDCTKYTNTQNNISD